MMRKIAATHIYPISSAPITNGVITIADDGTILNIDTLHEGEDVEFYEGIICPGFVNTHCHVELSHLRGAIPESTGMANFIRGIISTRNKYSEAEIQKSIETAEAEMLKNGIVAVGDISNNNSTFKQKEKQNLHYQTFVEVFDLNPANAKSVFETAKQLVNEYKNQAHISIVPHAPYSVSDELFALIRNEAVKRNSTLSIHNQESYAENELFQFKSGELFDLFSSMGINLNNLNTHGLNALQNTLPKLPISQKRLLVHNTFTTKEDIEFTINYAPSTIFWCTCPNANKYINNALPDYNIFLNSNSKITIGTDSLASNWSLSILDELKTITHVFPHIDLNTLLSWATKNGADFLNFPKLGTLEIGKKPGINLLQNTANGKISNATTVKVLA
jgi:aminodeoxyfutalosine deaminase